MASTRESILQKEVFPQMLKKFRTFVENSKMYFPIQNSPVTNPTTYKMYSHYFLPPKFYGSI